MAEKTDDEKKDELADYIDSQEVRQLFKISESCLKKWRQQKKIPYTRIGGKCFYKKSQILKILNDNRSGDL